MISVSPVPMSRRDKELQDQGMFVNRFHQIAICFKAISELFSLFSKSFSLNKSKISFHFLLFLASFKQISSLEESIQHKYIFKNNDELLEFTFRMSVLLFLFCFLYLIATDTSFIMRPQEVPNFLYLVPSRNQPICLY